MFTGNLLFVFLNILLKEKCIIIHSKFNTIWHVQCYFPRWTSLAQQRFFACDENSFFGERGWFDSGHAFERQDTQWNWCPWRTPVGIQSQRFSSPASSARPVSVTWLMTTSVMASYQCNKKHLLVGSPNMERVVINPGGLIESFLLTVETRSSERLPPLMTAGNGSAWISQGPTTGWALLVYDWSEPDHINPLIVQ